MRDTVLTIAGMLVFICGTYGLVLLMDRFSGLAWPPYILMIFLLATVVGIVIAMRPILKFYGSRFDPVLTIAGTAVFVCGVYGLVIVFGGWPMTMLIIPIFLLPTAMGIVTLVREYQLWKRGRTNV